MPTETISINRAANRVAFRGRRQEAATELQHQAEVLVRRLLAQQEALVHQLQQIDATAVTPTQIKLLIEHHALLGQAVEAVYGILHEAEADEEDCHQIVERTLHTIEAAADLAR